MLHKSNPHSLPSQDIGTAALAALCAIADKAGDTTLAIDPREGWPVYAGLHPRTWRRALRTLTEAGLAEVDGNTIKLPESGASRWQDMDDGERFVRVPPDILTVPPDARRAWLAALTLADFHKGTSIATRQTVGRRMGRSKTRAIRSLDKLAGAGAYALFGKRRLWRVQTVPKNGRHGLIAYSWLAEFFAFDFRPKSQIRQDLPISRGQRRTEERTEADRTRTEADQGRTEADPYQNPLPESLTRILYHGNPVGLPADTLTSAAVIAFPAKHERTARRVMAHLFSRKRNDAEMYQRAVVRQTGRHLPGMFGGVT